MGKYTLEDILEILKEKEYEITIYDAMEVYELLEESFETYMSPNIEMAIDYVLNGARSRYARYFN